LGLPFCFQFVVILQQRRLQSQLGPLSRIVINFVLVLLQKRRIQRPRDLGLPSRLLIVLDGLVVMIVLYVDLIPHKRSLQRFLGLPFCFQFVVILQQRRLQSQLGPLSRIVINFVLVLLQKRRIQRPRDLGLPSRLLIVLDGLVVMTVL